MRDFVLLALVSALPALLHAVPDHAQPRRLTGTYSIGTASLIDPKIEEQKDALLRIYLTGTAARDLFNTISSKAKRDECFDDGTMKKSAGEIMCAKHPRGTHECWIGIDLKKQALVAGFVC